MFHEIIEPVTTDLGFRAERADHDKAPGSITDTIIGKVFGSDLVIADLTDQNPNVMYELALRHAVGLPFVQMIESDQSLPFDVGDVNTIHFDSDLRGAAKARSDLKLAAEAALAGGSNPANPVRRTLRLNQMLASESLDAGVREILVSLRTEIAEVRSSIARAPASDEEPVGQSLADRAYWILFNHDKTEAMRRLDALRAEARQTISGLEMELSVAQSSLAYVGEKEKPILKERMRWFREELRKARLEADSIGA